MARKQGIYTWFKSQQCKTKNVKEIITQVEHKMEVNLNQLKNKIYFREIRSIEDFVTIKKIIKNLVTANTW